MGMESGIRSRELSPVLSTGAAPQDPEDFQHQLLRRGLNPERGLNLNPGLNMITEAHLQ